MSLARRDTVLAGDVPGHATRPEAECKDEDGFTRSLHGPRRSIGGFFPDYSFCDLMMHIKERLALFFICY